MDVYFIIAYHALVNGSKADFLVKRAWNKKILANKTRTI